MTRLRTLLNNAKGEVTKLRSSLSEAEEEVTKLKGSLTKVEDKASLVEHRVLEVAIEVIQAIEAFWKK